MNKCTTNFGWVLTGFIISMLLFGITSDKNLSDNPPKKEIKEVKKWYATCNEKERIESIKNCLSRYYKFEPVTGESSIIQDQQAFEVCRAAASWSYCKWVEK